MSPVASSKRRSRLYYGWVIVAGLSVVGAVNMSMGGVNYGLFVKPMAETLGTGQAIFGWASTARTAASGLAAPFLGRFLDQYGSRSIMAVAGLLAILALLALSRVTHAWQLVLVMGFIGFLGMQGGASLYTQVPVANWFVRKRGKAMSLAFVGGPIGLVATLPLTQLLIGHIGWRATWAVLGVSGGLLVSLIALLVVRRRPEDMGLLPDGVSQEEATAGEKATVAGGPRMVARVEEYPWTRKEALRSAAFWQLGCGFGLGMVGTASFTLFRIPYFIERGIAPGLVALGSATDALVVVLVTFAIGPVLDRLSLRHLGALGIGLISASLAIALVTTTPLLMFLSNIVFGLGIGLNIAAQNTIWPAYFGRDHIGSIRGVAFPLSLVFSGLGTPMVGIVRDLTGAYTTAWLVALAPMAIGAAILLFTRRPQPPGQGAALRPPGLALDP